MRMLVKFLKLLPLRYVREPNTPCLRGYGLTGFIAKALELFMDRIIKAVADETKARGARRVTPSHLYVPLFDGFTWFGCIKEVPQSEANTSYHNTCCGCFVHPATIP